jgi:hypothetical protein
MHCHKSVKDYFLLILHILHCRPSATCFRFILQMISGIKMLWYLLLADGSFLFCVCLACKERHPDTSGRLKIFVIQILVDIFLRLLQYYSLWPWVLLSL